jgi:hypothetical protein
MVQIQTKKSTEQESRLERTERLYTSVVRWRQESVRKSMIRPFYQEALKTLFLVAVLLVDSLIPLQFYVSLGSPFNIILTLVVFIIFLYVEVRIYNALWGKNGRWALSKYEVRKEQKDSTQRQ